MFIINLIPLHVFVLIAMGRYSRRIYIGKLWWILLKVCGFTSLFFLNFASQENGHTCDTSLIILETPGNEP